MARIVKAPDERRSELIACAQNLFYSKGYESTSVRDIVDEAGVAKGTFYYYFDSKQAVLEATVDELTAYSVALMRGIVDDETLSAEAKWVQAMEMVGNWKTARKTELVALLRMLQRDENALLQEKIRTKAMQMVAPELARIIKQGVEEGVFETEFVDESAEIAMATMTTLSYSIADTLLNPGNYDNPGDLLRRKLTAVQTATERVLGAAPGSLPLMDAATLDIWFEDREEPQREKVL